MHHDDDKALQRVEDSEEDLEERGAPVGDGQDGRHPGEGQQGQNHTGAPQGRPAGVRGKGDESQREHVSTFSQSTEGKIDETTSSLHC